MFLQSINKNDFEIVKIISHLSVSVYNIFKKYS